MQIAGDQLIRSTRKTIRHAHHDRLLQTKHIGQLGKLRDCLHDRELGRARIAKQVRDTLVEQQFDKSLAAGHFLNRHFYVSPRCMPIDI